MMPQVVTAVLTDKKKILILCRSNRVGTYQGLWSGVSGFVEKGENPYETALKEIGEETGFQESDVFLLKHAEPIEFRDVYQGKTYDWVVHPFLFFVKRVDVRLDWEHSSYRWIFPEELSQFRTVPRLRDVVALLLK